MESIFKKVILFFLGILIFVLPIAHTIAVRNISILIIILLVIYLLVKNKLFNRSNFLYNELKIIYTLLFCLTFWMLFVSIFISYETIWSIKEIKSEWIVPLLYFMTFLFLGIYSSNEEKNLSLIIYNIIVLVFFIHILYLDISAIYYYFIEGVFLTRLEEIGRAHV